MITKRCIIGLFCVALLIAMCVPWGMAYAKDDVASATETVPTTTVKTAVTTIIPTTTTVETTALSTTVETAVTAVLPTTTTTTTTTTVATTTAVSCVQAKSEGEWHWPLLQKNGAVSAAYGYRWGQLHCGVDITAAVGDPVVAAADGKVIACETEAYNGGYGMTVLIDHGDGIHTLYAHLEGIAVAVGDFVPAGQTIARVGMTGAVTGPCLHFEVRVNEVAVDPLAWLKDVNVFEEGEENAAK